MMMMMMMVVVTNRNWIIRKDLVHPYDLYMAVSSHVFLYGKRRSDKLGGPRPGPHHYSRDAQRWRRRPREIAIRKENVALLLFLPASRVTYFSSPIKCNVVVCVCVCVWLRWILRGVFIFFSLYSFSDDWTATSWAKCPIWRSPTTNSFRDCEYLTTWLPVVTRRRVLLLLLLRGNIFVGRR